MADSSSVFPTDIEEAAWNALFFLSNHIFNNVTGAVVNNISSPVKPVMLDFTLHHRSYEKWEVSIFS